MLFYTQRVMMFFLLLSAQNKSETMIFITLRQVFMPFMSIVGPTKEIGGGEECMREMLISKNKIQAYQPGRLKSEL